MSTISPSQALKIWERAAKIRPDVSLVDCPVSGGTPRAASGDLMILAGGLDQAGPGSGKAYHVLRLLSTSAGNKENLLIVPGGIGKGSAVKLVNQHLAGKCLEGVIRITTEIV
jgi:3-hydroxyisobutyrate dehydrogenase